LKEREEQRNYHLSSSFSRPKKEGEIRVQGEQKIRLGKRNGKEREGQVRGRRISSLRERARGGIGREGRGVLSEGTAEGD